MPIGEGILYLEIEYFHLCFTFIIIICKEFSR